MREPQGDRRTFLHQVAQGAAAFALTPALLPSAPRLRGAPLSVGLVGAGRWGVKLLAEIVKFEQVALTAIADTDEAGVRRGQRRAPQAAGYAGHEAMLEGRKDLEAVIVAAPTHCHAPIALDCLARGLHVYCEAPLAARPQDLQALVAAARSSKKVFQVGHLMRSNPVYALARSFLRSGNLRDLVALRAQASQKTSWQTPGDRTAGWKLYRETSTGLPGEFGSHAIDTIAWFTGLYPRRVRGAGMTLLWNDGREIPDTVHCTYDYPGGIALQLFATLASSFDGTYELFAGTMGALKMTGTHGWMFKESDAPTQGWEVYATREKLYHEEGIILIADATQLAKQGKLRDGIGLPNPPAFYALQDFLKSVIEGREVACTAADGLRAALVGQRGHQAVLTGTEQAIEEDLLKAS